MRLRPLIERELRRAFKLLEDQAVSATFQKRVATGFNFGTAELVSQEGDEVPAKVIVTKTTRKKEAVAKTLMVRSSEVGSLSLYAQVLMDDGDLWDIGEVIVDRGYILLLRIVKEMDNG